MYRAAVKSLPTKGALLHTLLSRRSPEEIIRVALIGAGSMGLGIASQLGATPGMTLDWIVDLDLEPAERAAQAYLDAGIFRCCSGPNRPQRRKPIISADFCGLLAERGRAVDVVVEATTSIGSAAESVLAALHHKIHVVLMNAEVDLLLGPLLHYTAAQNQVLVSSDAGDQHGVLMRMIEEVRLMGCKVVMAGNMKGFLDQYATAQSLLHEAQIRRLNPVQCVAYTDGTKCNIEMALVANAAGLTPTCPGMRGPRVNHVHDVFQHFDFSQYVDQGVVDYILGAQPDGGVFVVGYCDNPLQQFYLQYYKRGPGPFYLFYRPYHLCSLETPFAIASLVLRNEPILVPRYGKLTEVVAFAKADLPAGTRIGFAVGSDAFYGRVVPRDVLVQTQAVPVCLLECEPGNEAELRRSMKKDERLSFADLQLPESLLLKRYREQESLLARLSSNAAF